MVSFDAVASVRVARLSEVRAEADAVVAWARATVAGQEGPLDEGGAWDHELVVSDDGEGWHTLTITLTGDETFAALFEQVFEVLG